MASMMIVRGDDWEGLYIDGRLKREGHSIELMDALNLAIGSGVTNVDSIWCDLDWLHEVGNLPQNFDDVKRTVKPRTTLRSKMVERKHTPGPWVWRGKDGSLRQKGEPPYAYGETVLRPDYEYDSGVDTVVSEADAKLIAAAPDMLKALLDIVEVDDRDSRTDPDIAATDEWRAQVITNARAAIAKATHG